jgi:hypothetical protein
MKLYIRAYPKFTKVVSVGSLSDIKALSRRLAGKESITSSSLYSCQDDERYYLCFNADVKRLESQLGAICEHSERVFIGRYYYSIIREHYNQVLRDGAVRRLAQK